MQLPDAYWVPPGPQLGAGGRWLVGLTAGPVPLGALVDWAPVPSCGAVVSFTGTTRDHSVGADGALRHGVHLLEYEAWGDQALVRLAAVAEAVVERWPVVGRVALVHRTGPVGLGEASVGVVVATPHRNEAFEAARFAIDTLKVTVPVWKREHHADGTDWAAATDIVSMDVAMDGAPPGAGDEAPTDPAKVGSLAGTVDMADTGGAGGSADGTRASSREV
jgi:molybdopterin synthase catalytic subunit